MKVKIQDSRQKEGYRIVDLNRRKAIKEYCWNCSGFSRKERENCWGRDCELFPFRTGRGKQAVKARNDAIRAHCREHCMDGHPSYVTRCSSPDCPLYAYRQKKIDRSVEVVDKPVGSAPEKKIKAQPPCSYSAIKTGSNNAMQLSLF